MLRNFFKITLRNLWRHKLYSTINILGLSVGISVALVIFLIVHYEFSFDHLGKEGRRIYRVVLDIKFNGMPGHSGAVPAPLSGAVQKEMTGIAQTVPVFQFQGGATAEVTIPGSRSTPLVSYKKQENIIFTNQEYFQLLGFKWIAGSSQRAFLGLLGLVIFLANQRNKEIGIRKVLGASVVRIIFLLSKDFIRLVLIAFIIAAPIVWWTIHKWLQNFAYHTKLSWWIFLLSGATMLLIALTILFIWAGRTAMANPVESLRNE